MSAIAAQIAPSPAPAAAKQLARRETLRALARSKTFVVGMAIILWWVFCAFFGATIAPEDPLNQTASVLAGPSWHHLFGTDQLGRDVFSRVLGGARSILTIAPLATLLAIACGTSLGLVTGYFRGIVDDVVSRLIDAILSVPLIVLAVSITVSLGASTLTLIVVVGVLFTPLVARTVRAAVLAERELDYVPAARLRGERAPYVMFVEILPNIMAPIIVEATVRLGYAIFTIAGLSFLGFGVRPPSPDWALQISDNYTLLAAGTYWWTVLFPGLAIATLVIAINLAADGLSQVLER
jgi:peptide/nickel transport system permease protein